LKGLGASALVARAEVDAGAAKVTATTGCRIDKLKVAQGTVSFDRLDDALPMPIDPKAEPALNLAPVLEDIDRYELEVTGLAAGTYEVTVDGQLAEKFSADELAKGVNLANTAGPITTQARDLLKLVFEKNNLFFHRWRDIQLYEFPKWAQGQDVETKRTQELARLDQEIAEREKQIDEYRQPRPHHFEIKPASR